MSEQKFVIPCDWVGPLAELAADPAARVCLRALAAKLEGNRPAVEATAEEAAALVEAGAHLDRKHPAAGVVASLDNERAARVKRAELAQAQAAAIAARGGKVV